MTNSTPYPNAPYPTPGGQQAFPVGPIRVDPTFTAQVTPPTGATQGYWVIVANSSPWALIVGQGSVLGTVTPFTTDCFVTTGAQGVPLTLSCLVGVGTPLTPSSDTSAFVTWVAQRPLGTYPSPNGGGAIAQVAQPRVLSTADPFGDNATIDLAAGQAFPPGASPSGVAAAIDVRGYEGILLPMVQTTEAADQCEFIWYEQEKPGVITTVVAGVQTVRGDWTASPTGGIPIWARHLGPYLAFQAPSTNTGELHIAPPILNNMNGRHDFYTPFPTGLGFLGASSGTDQLGSRTSPGQTPLNGYTGPVEIAWNVNDAAGIGIFVYPTGGGNSLLYSRRVPSGTDGDAHTFWLPPQPCTLEIIGTMTSGSAAVTALRGA